MNRLGLVSLLATLQLVVAAIAQSSSQPTPPPSTQPAADDQLEAQLAEIDRRAAAITDLSADFVQLKHTGLLKKPLESKGALRVKGDLMRWDTAQPSRGVMTIDASEMRLYSPGRKLLEIYPMQKGLGQIAASPLPRLAVIRQHFHVERFDWPAEDFRDEKSKGQLAIRLTPREESLGQHVREVRVLLNPQTGCARAVRMIDPDDDELEIVFSNVRLNTGLRDDQVRFDPPKDTVISRPLEGRSGAGETP